MPLQRGRHERIAAREGAQQQMRAEHARMRRGSGFLDGGADEGLGRFGERQRARDDLQLRAQVQVALEFHAQDLGSQAKRIQKLAGQRAGLFEHAQEEMRRLNLGVVEAHGEGAGGGEGIAGGIGEKVGGAIGQVAQVRGRLGPAKGACGHAKAPPDRKDTRYLAPVRRSTRFERLKIGSCASRDHGVYRLAHSIVHHFYGNEHRHGAPRKDVRHRRCAGGLPDHRLARALGQGRALPHRDGDG
ncbi:MAG: hypothetical protein M5U26_14625 [Planctomycetota bacterium]|nr:hypothetical protein [Planctomycetota bacterium]